MCRFNFKAEKLTVCLHYFRDKAVLCPTNVF